MNWLKRVAQILEPEKIIMGVIQNEFDGSGPSVSQPAGGWAYQQMKNMGPDPQVCQMINTVAGLNAAARPKMQLLAEAAGCEWAPGVPQNPDQPQQSDPHAVMPPMGQQEQPTDMPSMEIE